MDEDFSPKVSVIIPCFNNEAFVGEAIQSALAQTYKNLEIVCVNDGSWDNSAKIIRKYAEKYSNILFFDEKENRGVCYARNFAIEASMGEYILPLDADDKIAPEYVEKAVQVLNKRPDIGIVYCRAKVFGVKNKIWNLPEFDADKILYENCIFNSALFRKKDFIKCGGYNENMTEGCEDWDLWLSFIENGFGVLRLNEVLFYYRKIKSKTRTDVADSASDSFLDVMLKKHINLYMRSSEFYSRVFRKQKNKKKYRKLFNIFLAISIIELVLILVVTGKYFML